MRAASLTGGGSRWPSAVLAGMRNVMAPDVLAPDVVDGAPADPVVTDAPGAGPAGLSPALRPEAIPDEAVSYEALPDDASDPVLSRVRRAQQGDAEAFGELYDSYVDLVFRYIHYRVASRQLAEDLTAETFLRALRRIGSFTWQGRDIGAWFVTIARNLVADHYKSSRYRLELVTDDVATAAPGLSVPGPEGEVLTGLRNQALLQAVRRLGSEQQECVALRFLQGLSVAETAQIMGKNDAAVKALQYRAVKSLGRLLDGVEL